MSLAVTATQAVRAKLPSPGSGLIYSSSAKSPANYNPVILADGPVIFWPLNDPSGTTAADLTGNTPGTYTGTYTLNSPGPPFQNSSTFLNTGYVIESTNNTNYQHVSVECWYKTNTVSGGGVIMYGETSLVVYMHNDGTLSFGIYDGSATRVAGPTSKSYNDNLWHYIAATFDATSTNMLLYVDAVQVASFTASTYVSGTTWQVGNGYNVASPGAWPGTPASNRLIGSAAAAAVYSYVLTPAQITSHLNAGSTPGAIADFKSTGRVSFSGGAPVNNPLKSGATPPQRRAVHARRSPPPRGRIASNPGAPVQNPAQPSAFLLLVQPVRAKLPLLPLLSGRIAGHGGGPVQNASQGPVFQQASSPVRARQPLPRRGTCRAIRFYPLSANPASGPAFTPAFTPIRSRILPPPRGRIASNQGAPVNNPAPPAIGPVFYPGKFARARQPLPRRGTCRAIRFYPLTAPPTPGPVFTQAAQPARIRPALPPRGRCITGSPGAPVSNPPPPIPQTGPCPVLDEAGNVILDEGGSWILSEGCRTPSQQPGPVRGRITPPPRGRILGNNGATVQNPQPGPVFRQAARPIRAVIPQNAPRGRTNSNPGGPVVNPVPGAITFTYGIPYFEWEYGTPHF